MCDRGNPRACALTVLLAAAVATTAIQAVEDIVIADFEGGAYPAGWSIAGEAFGTKPAVGKKPLTGFLGSGLASSLAGGDPSVGTLTSASFTIERPFINFLIGGGFPPEDLFIQLLIDGQSVRTGNVVGQSIHILDAQAWNVAEFLGWQAVVQIVDNGVRGRGHIAVDQIVQSERARETAQASHTFQADKHYLHIPIKKGAPKRMVSVKEGGKEVYRLELELVPGGAAPADVVAMDLSRFKGRTLTFDAGKITDGDQVFKAGFKQDDQLPGHETIYKEAYRPQFHFTSKIGWLNDANGLVYHEGEWHLFYQHNPYSPTWGNMHWGHAVSTDLVHWRELDSALYAYSDAKGQVWSGSAVIDHKNTSGFGKNGKPPLVVAFSDHGPGSGESLAYSNDNGRTFTPYSGNPVLVHPGRDPKLLWHEGSQRWVMALYSKFEDKGHAAFYTSPDLKTWELQSRLPDFYECVDLFPLPVIGGQPGETRWVVHGGDVKYLVGDFDGKTFTPEGGAKHEVWHGQYYAAQTFDNVPGGRRVQIGWARGLNVPGLASQQMAVPVELTLHATQEGVRMQAYPVEELKALRGAPLTLPPQALSSTPATLAIESAELDLEAEFTVGPDAQIQLGVLNVPIKYDAASTTLEIFQIKLPLKPADGKVRLRILLDRASVEVFGNGGQIAFIRGNLPAAKKSGLSLTGSDAATTQLTVWPMRSIWEANPDAQNPAESSHKTKSQTQ